MSCDTEHLQKTYGITWEQLVELEPRLGDLLWEVELARPTENEDDFNYEICWGRFKNPIADLVGFHRRHGDERLRTTEAYRVAYYKLWHALHD